MKKAMVVPTIPPDSRMLAAYDREVAHVEAVLEEIREELRGGGYDATDEQVLNAAFKKDWLEGFERSRLATVAEPARGLLESVAVARVQPLAARLDDLRIQIAGAGFVHDAERTVLNIRRSDIERIGDKLRVNPANRSQFIDGHTRRLNDEEAEAYIIFADVLPKLKALKAKGWAVCPIVEGRVGKVDWMPGVEGLDHLENDIVKYRKIK